MKEKAGMRRDPIWVAGTMSGTSLDGVDAAMILTDGVEVFEYGASDYRGYTDAERAVLRQALGRWQGEDGVAEAAQIVETAHIELLSGFEGTELIGFHGQTLAHDPSGKGTHQAGDGTVLAEALDLPVVWDFRSADVAAGGQGAPFASAYHFALAKRAGATEPQGFLNMGGVGNLTWLDPTAPEPFAPEAMLAFDTGPANAPLNDLMQARFGQALDKDGALSAQGKVDADVIKAFSQNPYFEKTPPKSLDRDDFPALLQAVAHLPDADAAATLLEASAWAVARSLAWCPNPPARILVTGGGRHNPVLMAQLAARLPCEVVPVEAIGADGDMLEAQAFAYLAARSLSGLPLSGPGSTGVPEPCLGGQVSFFDQVAQAARS